MRCAEGASVRNHIGDIRAAHMELAEMGTIIEDHLLAIAILNLYPSPMIQMRRESKSEDVNIATQKICCNCKKPGHTMEDCYSKGGGKEGQGPRQISRRKREEAKIKKKNARKIEQDIQAAEDDAFHTSHMALVRTPKIESKNFTSYSWSHDLWIADSGASSHIANRREMFFNYTPSKGTLNVAGGLTANIEGTGVVYMRGMVNGKQNDFKLMNVLHVPTTRYWTLDGNMYHVNAKAYMFHFPMANSVSSPVVSWNEAHRRLGHLSLISLTKIFDNGLIEGIKISEHETRPKEFNCGSCTAAKAHREPFSKLAERRSSQFGELTHSDVLGSSNIKHTPDGNQYFVLFIDDYTRFITVKLIKDKAS
ncbi:hypothetical protein EPUL_005203, partial [Erysiphe pulchra]